MNERMMRRARTAKSQPRLVCVLAASLAVSICGLRGLVGSFLVSCPRGPPLQGRGAGRSSGVLRSLRPVMGAVGAVGGSGNGNSIGYGNGYDYGFGKSYVYGTNRNGNKRNGNRSGNRNGNSIENGNGIGNSRPSGSAASTAGTGAGTALSLVHSSNSLSGAFETHHASHGLRWADGDDGRELQETEEEEEEDGGGGGFVANRRSFGRQGGGVMRRGRGGGGGGGKGGEARTLAAVNRVGGGGDVGDGGEEMSTLLPASEELREGVRGGVEGDAAGGGGGGGVDRGGFIRAVVGGLVAGPVIGDALQGGGVPAAEAATLDRTRLGTPILTESVLLDLLPIFGQRAKVLRAIQDEIEKATILRTLYRRVNYSQTGSVVEQLTVPPSVWDRVLSVAEGALEMLVDQRADLEPVFREMDSAETQIRRAEYSEAVFARAQVALKSMAAGARAKLPPAVLSAQEDALLALGRIGELFDAGFPFEINAGEMYDSIPRLLGRATVEVTVRREAEGPKGKARVLGNVTMVVDGYSSPVTAGNFIDLALRGFYNELPIRFDGVPAEAQVGAENNETLSTVVSGSYREGFVDPATGTLRRLPLEILRVEKKGNAPVYGAARNTKVFTKAPAVQTFRIPFAIAMNHPALDGNGASSEFFWLQDENLEKDGYLMNQRVEALDGRYAIFAYAVGNRKLLGRLKDGDVIEKVTVTYGEDNLIRPKSASFKELLLKGGNSDDVEE